jgi:hypothetical protein
MYKYNPGGVTTSPPKRGGERKGVGVVVATRVKLERSDMKKKKEEAGWARLGETRGVGVKAAASRGNSTRG